ncbi:sulfate transporter CysZ [Pasteurellaceae bacterium RH1A]|nr:sulfate transporter CysZ [Pasteurellaceae bacterium RH1A]
MTSPFDSPQNPLAAGFHYFIYGWKLMMQRSLLPFIVLPILINVVLIVGLIWLFLSYLSGWMDVLVSFTPSWLDWLSYLIIPLALLLLLVLFYFAFTTLANFIAAPFNALLSEKVELQLTGESLGDTSIAAMLKDVPRMLKREWQKMWYSIPRLIALFLLGFVPVLGQSVVPVLAFMFSAWLVAIQYCDYPFDNHKISFGRMRNALAEKRTLNFTFGSLVSLFTMLPFVNLVVMPVAVCGATAMWVKEYRHRFVGQDLKPTFSRSASKEVATRSASKDLTKP